MRALTGLLAVGAALALAPSTARAADTPMCDLSPVGDIAYQQRLTPFLTQSASTTPPGGTVTTSGGQAAAAAQSVLGPQYVLLWADTPRQGWTVAFSPGAHDATTARAAIRADLATRVSAQDVDYLDRTLTLLPTPYSRADLDAASAELAQQISATSLVGSFGVGCSWSDAVRIEVGIADAESPELRAQAEALLAPFGDLVRVRYGVGRPVPAIGPVRPVPEILDTEPPAAEAPRLRDHVTLPSTARCVRGGTLKVKAGTQVRKLRLAAGSRKAFGAAGKPAKLKLKARRTKVAVTVTLQDGGTVTQTFTYRRC